MTEENEDKRSDEDEGYFGSLFQLKKLRKNDHASLPFISLSHYFSFPGTGITILCEVRIVDYNSKIKIRIESQSL